MHAAPARTRRRAAAGTRAVTVAAVATASARVLCLLAAIGCHASPRALTPAHEATVEAEARAYLATIPRDLEADGPLAWLPHLTRDAFSMASQGRLAFASFADAEALVCDFAPTVERMHLTWHDLHVDVLTHDLAIFGTDYDETIEETSGADKHFAGYVTGVVVRTAAGWRVRQLHWSQPLPEP